MWNISESGQNGSLTKQNCGDQQGVEVILAIMLALVVFSMGCSVDVRKVWLHMRHPWAILVGLLCQFGIMPLIAYLLALAFAVTPVQAVAIIFVGSSPGGTISNIITYWVDGDMNLSITMTSVSTLLGLGTMPLCLYIYSHPWIQTEHVSIPYLYIGITSITLLIPVAFGVLVNFKWPKGAKIILRIGSLVGGLAMLGIGVAAFVLCEDLWSTDTSIFVIGGIFPAIGCLAGFIISVIAQQSWDRCRTIAMETGAQNMQLCGTLLHLFFQTADVITLPIVYSSFQLLIGLLLVIVFQIYKRMLLKKNSVPS